MVCSFSRPPSILAFTLIALGPILSVSAAAQAGEVCITQRLTFSSAGSTNVDGECGVQAVSADGLFAAFESSASNMVIGDTNGQIDVFVVNLTTLEIELISVSDAGVQGNLDSQIASISEDGRFVAFHSFSDNLVPGDTNGVADVFVRDRQSGSTERVSLNSTGQEGDARSFKGAISGNGQFVAFCSDATNLVAADQNGVSDVFLHDRLAGTTKRVTEAHGGGDSNFGTGNLTYPWRRLSVSAEGRYVAFATFANNLVPGDSNGWDVFVRDVVAGTTALASVNGGGGPANGESNTPHLSADGRYVVFRSWATNLVIGDTNGVFDIYRRDLRHGVNVRINTSATGAQSAMEGARAAISPSGQFVAFESRADDLVLGDTNNKTDIFVKDLADGSIRMVSCATNGNPSNAYSAYPSIAAGGSIVTYISPASSLAVGETYGRNNMFAGTCGLSAPEIYCTAKVNSQGCLPAIAFTGIPTYTEMDDFKILASNIVSGKPGVFFWSQAPLDAPFQGGTLCVSPPLIRTPTQFSGGSGTPDCTGTYTLFFTKAYMAAKSLVPGSTVYCQYFYRDTAHVDGTMTGLTDALHFEVLP